MITADEARKNNYEAIYLGASDLVKYLEINITYQSKLGLRTSENTFSVARVKEAELRKAVIEIESRGFSTSTRSEEGFYKITCSW
ncbi:hypothetical protein E8A66_14850 [Vibrio cholerae]|uniref:hypothetical protein n=1 Tax=Vibrio cholerae TaxID=666 RepID=UPI0013B389C9|nr:hypothetical protein [Vibrio cholerae]EGR0542731.1 hypothetical protein [Vibrio cholerae]EII3092988.1 hypothetical protein [Vibrio cholerae]EIP5900438.1 hypothetical protein [Vibrio cholerae]EJL6421569.1 hypothetical protein [Vibrio cholerae]EJL6469116.1 hypothetical protein [Vibrio cholerae]